jgi:hypothetical protein
VTLGLVVFWRTAKIALAAWNYFPAHAGSPLDPVASTELLIALIQCTLLVSFTLGFATPLASLLLLLSYNLFDRFLGTMTLGTNVFTLLLIAMFVLNAGRQFSLDAIFMRRDTLIAGFIRYLYSFWGVASCEFTRNVHTLLFLSYALISIAALTFHVQDPCWMSGTTLELMLTNSYLSQHYEVFRSLLENHSDVFRDLSVLGVIGQSLFQALMVPLLFTRVGYWLVVFWGAQFFIVSAMTLQLSYLPPVELVYWFVLFFPRSSPQLCAPAVVQTQPVLGRQNALLAYGVGLLATFSVYTTLLTCGVSIPPAWGGYSISKAWAYRSSSTLQISRWEMPGPSSNMSGIRTKPTFHSQDSTDSG